LVRGIDDTAIRRSDGTFKKTTFYSTE